MSTPPSHNITSRQIGISAPDGQPGRIYGELDAEEDVEELARLLIRAPDEVLDSSLTLLTHADDRPTVSEKDREAEKAGKVEALRRAQLKRYVFAAQTRAGPRIVKIAETSSAGNHLLGLFSSVARREHRYHDHCHKADLAACRSLGFLEWRSGPRLRRALQVQQPVAESMPLLEPFLAQQLERYGLAALEPFAEAMAHAHRAPFFHADLKAFHAYVDELHAGDDGEPARYHLRWIDLARVSFHMTRRKRIINLYQCLRFVIPEHDAAQQQFMGAYCRAADWYAAQPERPLSVVRRLLARKLVSHPRP